MTEHTVKSYDEELRQVTALLSRMGALAEKQVAASVKAITRGDVEAAEMVIADDERLDALELDIDARCTQLVALRQPVADDLRHIMSAVKIAGNLERCGDLAKSIAKRALQLTKADTLPLTHPIERMGKLAASRLHEVLHAYAAKDLPQAVVVWASDSEIDERYNSLFRELLTYMMGDPRTITACTHLLFVAKNLERIGDHATNIAEIVHYELTGKALMQPRPKGAPL